MTSLSLYIPVEIGCKPALQGKKFSGKYPKPLNFSFNIYLLILIFFRCLLSKLSLVCFNISLELVATSAMSEVLTSCLVASTMLNCVPKESSKIPCKLRLQSFKMASHPSF